MLSTLLQHWLVRQRKLHIHVELCALQRLCQVFKGQPCLCGAGLLQRCFHYCGHLLFPADHHCTITPSTQHVQALEEHLYSMSLNLTCGRNCEYAMQIKKRLTRAIGLPAA